jgi:hypothetical protein
MSSGLSRASHPQKVIWETLIVDPRIRDLFRRTPQPKRNALFRALTGGRILIAVALAVSLFL